MFEEEFKDKIINDFGSIHVFRCKALKQFSHLDQTLQGLQELVEQLVPAIKTLKSHIKCVATFNHPVLLYNNTLTSSLNFDVRNYFLIPHGVVVECLGLLGEVFGDEIEDVGS